MAPRPSSSNATTTSKPKKRTRTRSRKTRTAAVSSSSSSSSDSESESESQASSSSSSSDSHSGSELATRKVRQGEKVEGTKKRGETRQRSSSSITSDSSTDASSSEDFPAPRLPPSLLPSTSKTAVSVVTTENDEEARRRKEEARIAKAKARERRREAKANDFRAYYMRQITDAFGDDLDEMRKREPMLPTTSRLPLLIDALASGVDIFSTDALTSYTSSRRREEALGREPAVAGLFSRPESGRGLGEQGTGKEMEVDEEGNEERKSEDEDMDGRDGEVGIVLATLDR